MTTNPDLAALYQRGLRDLAAKVRSDKRLVPADISVTRTSRTCGSIVTLDIRREADKITALGWRTRACTLGMAATAIVVQQATGREFSGIVEIGHLLRRLLSGEDIIFPEPWRELEMFAAARGFPTRHSSILLPFEIISEAGNETSVQGTSSSRAPIA